IEPLGPVELVHILAALDEAAVGAIDRIEEAIAPEMADHFASLAVDTDVVEHVDADFVPIPRIVRRILVVPDQLAGLDVERHDRVGVEVVAGARLRIVLRDRVAGAPDRELGGRIIRAGLPEPAAAGLPGVVLVLPGLAPWLARLRDGIPAPQFVTGPGIKACDPAARSRIACAVRDDHFAFGGDRRGGKPLLAAEFVDDGDLLVPDDFAAVAVERDHASVGQDRDHQVFPQRNAARLCSVAFVPDARIAGPDELTLVRSARVDLVDRAP